MSSTLKRLSYEFYVPLAAVSCAETHSLVSMYMVWTNSSRACPFLLHSQEIQEEQRVLLLHSPDSAWEGAPQWLCFWDLAASSVVCSVGLRACLVSACCASVSSLTSLTSVLLTPGIWGSSGDLVSSFCAAAGLYPSSLQSISACFCINNIWNIFLNFRGFLITFLPATISLTF